MVLEKFDTCIKQKAKAHAHVIILS